VLIAIFCINAHVSITEHMGDFFSCFFLCAVPVCRLLKIESHADKSGHCIRKERATTTAILSIVLIMP